MKQGTLLLTLSMIGASVIALSAYANSGSAQDFVRKASAANAFEIESSKLALKKSPSGDVKTFAQTMVDDHTTTAGKLGDALKISKSRAHPSDKLDDKQQKLMGQLETASGTAFDSQYIAMQTDAHKEAVDLFGDYAKNGSDPALKDFAARTLPTLQTHLQHVEQLAGNH